MYTTYRSFGTRRETKTKRLFRVLGCLGVINLSYRFCVRVNTKALPFWTWHKLKSRFQRLTDVITLYEGNFDLIFLHKSRYFRHATNAFPVLYFNCFSLVVYFLKSGRQWRKRLPEEWTFVQSAGHWRTRHRQNIHYQTLRPSILFATLSSHHRSRFCP